MKPLNEWSGCAVYFTFLGIALAAFVLICNIPNILPITSSDKFYIDKYEYIHDGCYQDNCKRKAWFKKKWSKYHILIGANCEFCDRCFDEDEIKKLETIHRFNYYERLKAYKDYLTEEEAKIAISKYRKP